MSTDQVERRSGQRFEYHVPVCIQLIEPSQSLSGFTQNLSARGAFLYTDKPIPEGAFVDLTLTLPSEITLGEGMRVRCRSRVLRTVECDHGKKSGIAVQFENYEYLPKDDAAATGTSFDRIAPLHEHAIS